ncbi:MAG: crossover junction endodeoxyribonuclease RuvC [Planctomycetota bacterium]
MSGAMGGGDAVRILGIDPGSVVVGFGCLEIREVAAAGGGGGAVPLAHAASNTVHRAAGAGAVRVVEAGATRLGTTRTPVADRLLNLQRAIAALIERVAAHELALEEAFYGKSVASALRIGEARGVILAGARDKGLEVHQFSPARIKRAVTGSGAASKDAVAELVARQLALATMPQPRDATDALAAAYCRAQERRVPRLR